MTEAIDPKHPTPPDDGWQGVDFDGIGRKVLNGREFPAYSPETGLPVNDEIDALGNPPGTEYDFLGNLIPLR